MQSKYGFVYIWRDRKNNRYYLGSHWGTTQDRYICSSNWMRMAYKRRPQDFKRRIIKIVPTNRQDLLAEEQRWLNLIKDEELSKRYYNHNKLVLYNAWWMDPKRGKTIGERISQKTKGRRLNPAGEIKPGQRISLATEIKPGQRKSPATEFQKSQSTWNRGLSTPKDVRKRQSISAKLRGRNSPSTEFKSKSHCQNGHEFTKENTYIFVDKNRHKHKNCKTCSRDRKRQYGITA